MRIAVTGEGPTDYGKRDYDTGKWIEGPLQKYAKKIAEKVLAEEVELCVLEKESVKNIRIQRKSLKGLEGFSVPAKKFTYWMKEQGIRKGIYYCDADREGSEKNTPGNAEKRFRTVYNQIAIGLAETEAIPVVALHMIESWLLGDKKALEIAFRVSIPNHEMPSKPEYLWGEKTDPNSSYPKNYLKRLIAKSDKRYADFKGNQKDFCEIAEASDLECMRKNCPISFEKFYMDFVNMICK